GQRPVQRRPEPRELRPAPDHRRVVVEWWRRAPRRLGGRRSQSSQGRAGGRRWHRAAAEDFLIELPRLGLGLDAQLSPKGLDTAWRLPQGGVATALTGIHPYQRSVHGLLERIEGEQASGRLHGKGFIRLGLVAEQPGQRLEGQVAQPLPFGGEPFLEGKRGNSEALEEVPSVEVGSLLEGRRGALAHGPLEGKNANHEFPAIQRRLILRYTKPQGRRSHAARR